MEDLINSDDPLEIAERLRVDGRLEEALDVAQEIVSTDAGNWIGRALAAEIMRDLGRLDESRVEFDCAVNHFRGNTKAESLSEYEYSFLAFVFLELGAVCWRLANIKRDKSIWLAAADAYSNSLDLDDNSAHGWHGYGYSKWKLGDKKQAVAALNRAIQCDEKFADAYVSLFQCELSMLHFREALRAYKAGRPLLYARISEEISPK